MNAKSDARKESVVARRIRGGKTRKSDRVLGNEKGISVNGTSGRLKVLKSEYILLWLLNFDELFTNGLRGSLW